VYTSGYIDSEEQDPDLPDELDDEMDFNQVQRITKI